MKKIKQFFLEVENLTLTSKILIYVFIHIFNENGNRNFKYKWWTSVKVYLYVGDFSLPLILLFFVTFPRSLAQIFRCGSISVRKFFLNTSCVFEVMTHFVERKGFFWYAFCYCFEYNPWDLNVIPFLFCMIFPTIESKVDTIFQPFLLRNTELSYKTQPKTCMIVGQNFFDIFPLPQPRPQSNFKKVFVFPL